MRGERLYWRHDGYYIKMQLGHAVLQGVKKMEKTRKGYVNCSDSIR